MNKKVQKEIDIFNFGITEKALEEITHIVITVLKMNNIRNIDSCGVSYISSRNEVAIFNYCVEFSKRKNEKKFELFFKYPLYEFLTPDSYCVDGSGDFLYGTFEERIENCENLRKKINEYEKELKLNKEEFTF